MHRLYRLRSLSNRISDLRCVEVKGMGIDINEYRSRTEPRHRAHGRKKTIRCGDNLVTRFDSNRHQRKQQSIAARCASDGVFRSAIRGELFFERLDFGTEDERITIQHAPKGGLYFRT